MEEKIKYSKDGRVKFIDETHQYILDGKSLKSVTQHISKFKSPFDKERISKAYAKKHGRRQEDVLAEWDEKRDESARMGTDLHFIFESYIKTGKWAGSGDWEKESVVYEFINDYFVTGKMIPVETELIVYSEEYGLAGQIDCIVKNSKGDYYIIDWKTNKEIKTNNIFQTMRPPYQSYPDCNYYHYCLQLSIYKALCKEYPIKGSFIVHIDTDEYVFYPVEEMKINL